MSMPKDQDRDDAPDGFLSRWSRRKAQVRQGQLPAEPAPATPTMAPLAKPVPAGDERRSATAHTAAQTAAQAATAEPDAPAPVQAEALPTLEDVAALPRGAEVRRFVAPGVSSEVRNAALKNLFADPHFNIKDGLDTYIDDYGKPDPLPAGMLRQMVQSQMLGLFKDDEPPAQPDTDRSEPHPVHGPGEPPVDPPADRPAEPQADALPGPDADPAPAPPTAAEDAPDEDPDLRLQPNHATGPGRPAPGAEPDPGRQR